MPLYEFECTRCGRKFSEITKVDQKIQCCGVTARKLVSVASIIVKTNAGRKLKTRVNLDDELHKQGFESPLFRSEEHKDRVRHVLKKEGIK